MHDTLIESDQLVDELIAADVLLIGAPLYNFGMPAALKAWIDQIVRPGRTVDINEGNLLEPYVPLLADRQRHALILSTRGGIGFGLGGEMARWRDGAYESPGTQPDHRPRLYRHYPGGPDCHRGLGSRRGTAGRVGGSSPESGRCLGAAAAASVAGKPHPRASLNTCRAAAAIPGELLMVCPPSTSAEGGTLAHSRTPRSQTDDVHPCTPG